MDIGPKKNVIKDLKDAFAENAPDVKFGLYYSLREWFNPIFLIDEHNGWTSRYFLHYFISRVSGILRIKF